jgi:hypothetical protein
MATSQAAYKAEQAIKQDDPAIITQQDVATYKGVGDDSESMKALVWQGKNKVEVGMSLFFSETSIG